MGAVRVACNWPLADVSRTSESSRSAGSTALGYSSGGRRDRVGDRNVRGLIVYDD